MSALARIEVDALGLLCPLPLLRAEAAIARERKAGASSLELILWSDDEGIVLDLPRWCEGQGHDLVTLEATRHACGRTAWRGLVRVAQA